MPPKICNQSNFFWELHFGSGIKKICLSVFTGCHGLAGREFVQPILKRKRTTKWNPIKIDQVRKSKLFNLGGWPPKQHSIASLARLPPRPAQRQVAGKPQKTTFRFLKVSEKKSWQTRLYQNVYTPYQRFYKTFSTKNMPKTFKNEKHHFRSGIKIFALGAFTGYPVLPGVSASLSDGEREYREKQIIIAMVTQSSSEHDLQKLLGV